MKQIARLTQERFKPRIVQSGPIGSANNHKQLKFPVKPELHRSDVNFAVLALVFAEISSKTLPYGSQTATIAVPAPVGGAYPRSFSPMILNVRNTLAPLALVAMILSTAACKGNSDGAEKKEAAKEAAKAEKREPVIKGIAGLDTERKQFSYMIGMDIGKSISPVKAEIDMETLVEAMKTVMKDGKPLLTDEQAKEIGKAFGERMMAKQAAERETQIKKNLEEGVKFLAENKKKPNVKTTESGLQYQILRPGNGPKPKATDMVLAHYVGTFLDGKKFDSSYDRGQPAEFALNAVIPGWTEGLQLMSKGSKFKFWIPADLGYGAEGQGNMPPNATLVFEVELQDVKAGPAPAPEAMPQQ